MNASVSNKRHVWTKEENEYFMQACLKLAEESSFFRGQTDKYAARKIRLKMVHLGAAELPHNVVLNKYIAFKSYWKKSRQLRYEPGSTFDPETGLFNNSEEWWTLKIAIDEKVRKFRNGIPHAKELDIIFKNLEDFPMSSSSCNRSCSFGCQPSVSQMISVQQAPIPNLESMMDELSDAGLNRTDDVMITALIHLKDPEVRKWYSQTPSIEDKITILKKLHKQGHFNCHCCAFEM